MQPGCPGRQHRPPSPGRAAGCLLQRCHLQPVHLCQGAWQGLARVAAPYPGDAACALLPSSRRWRADCREIVCKPERRNPCRQLRRAPAACLAARHTCICRGRQAAELLCVQALRWEEVATSAPQAPVASEGLSLLAVPSQGALLAFGGYNGRYHSSVQMLWPGGPPCAGTAGAAAAAALWACMAGCSPTGPAEHLPAWQGHVHSAHLLQAAGLLGPGHPSWQLAAGSSGAHWLRLCGRRAARTAGSSGHPRARTCARASCRGAAPTAQPALGPKPKTLPQGVQARGGGAFHSVSERGRQRRRAQPREWPCSRQGPCPPLAWPCSPALSCTCAWPPRACWRLLALRRPSAWGCIPEAATPSDCLRTAPAGLSVYLWPRWLGPDRPGACAGLRADSRGMSRVSSLGGEGSKVLALETELEAARREVAAAKQGAAMELALLRHQLAGVQQALADAEAVRRTGSPLSPSEAALHVCSSCETSWPACSRPWQTQRRCAAQGRCCHPTGAALHCVAAALCKYRAAGRQGCAG